MEDRNRRNGKGKKARRRRRQKKWFALGLLLLFLCLAGRGVGTIIHSARGGSGHSRALFSGRQAGFSKESNLSFLLNAEYPDSLKKLAQHNPETIDFVKHYPQKKDQQGKIDVSDDLDGGIPQFFQWDERWGYRQYGGDYMAVNGCGPTCLSMVWCGLTGKSKWNPYQLARKAETEGYYVKGAGTAWDLMTKGAADLGLQVENLDLNEGHILGRLERGNPIICVVGPGDFTTQGHFLVLTGVDRSGKIILNDPNSPKRSNKKWELDRLMSQIRNLWAYSI